MQCPYCAEDIQDAAIVCRYCHHDLAPSKPLIEENKTLIEQIEKLQAELSQLRSQAARSTADARAIERRKSAPVRKAIEELLIYGLVPIVLLWVAHLLIIVLWDQSTVYLRIVSMVVPIPFGFALIWRERHNLAWTMILGAVVSALAIAGMLVVMHVVFHDTILPTTTRDLIEELQYFTSIALAFITGGLLAVLFRGSPNLAAPTRSKLFHHKLKPLVASVRRKKSRGKQFDVFEIIQHAHRLHRIFAGVTAIATAIGSIYTGMMGLMH